MDLSYPDDSYLGSDVFVFFFYFIHNTHNQRTDKLCLIDVANEFEALNENRKSNFGTFKESDIKMSG